IAHFHLVMGISAAFGFFCGIYQWYPKMFGKMMNKTLGYIHFWITIIGVYGVFFPLHFVGLAALPRRYYHNTAFLYFGELMDLNVLRVFLCLMVGIGLLSFLYYFFVFMSDRAHAPKSPWKSNSLEWTSSVARIHGYCPAEFPIIYRWPYDYTNLITDGTD